MKEGVLLSHLLEGLINDPLINDLYIKGLENDSRRVSPGDLFLAYQGHRTHGLDFSSQAIEHGAVAIARDELQMPQPAQAAEQSPALQVMVPDLRSKVGVIANRFYADPSQGIPVIAVTGTDGKTSVTHFIAQALTLAGKRCGVLGTLGAGWFGDLTPTANTTPDSLFIQKFVHSLKQQDADYMVLEASSHGIDQDRLNGLAVDVAVLTNIGNDHLDYHASVEDYVTTKCKLFRKPSVRYAIINRDSQYRDLFIKACGEEVQVLQYSLKDDSADVYVKSLNSSPDGLELHLSMPPQDIHLKSAVMGDFNAANLMAALLVLHSQGMDLQNAAACLSQVTTPKGRMELFHTRSKATVVLDYAHTPDALRSVLDTCRKHCPGKLICVFGCGGDRDHAKRSVMGAIASQKSDRVIVTDDNPRCEDPDKIICDIQQDCATRRNIQVIRDRREAIMWAIEEAQEGDLVVIAGKGHETGQVIGDTVLPFSDSEVIEQAVRCGNELA